MRNLTLLSLAALLSVACQSNRYSDSTYPTSTPTVSDDVYVLVPEKNRSAIAENRAERIRMQDGVAIAERDLMMERQRLDGAKLEAKQAGESMTAARRAVEVADESGQLRREDEMDRAADQIDRARARWHQARSQVAFHESRIAQLEAEVKLAKLRVELADAKVELDKARAVAELDRPESKSIAIRDFEANVAELKAHGVNIIGTSPESIDAAEDRELFKQILIETGLRQPANKTVLNEAQAYEMADQVGFPLLLRPSFVLGGRGMFIVHTMEEMRAVIRQAFDASPDKPVLLDKFLEDAIELDVDCISDGHTTVVGGMLEHIEYAGVHSGDAAMVLPPHTLGAEMIETVRQASYRLAKALKVVGLMNIQYAIKGDDLYVLEVNPRASRTVPFVSKAIGIPLAKLGAKVMTGLSLEQLGFTEEKTPRHWCIKEAVFPFARFPGATIRLGPEMRSTGEVMGLDEDFGIAFAKTQAAAKPPLPLKGNVFLSVKDQDKPKALLIAQGLVAEGFKIYSTSGTAKYLSENGIETKKLFRIAEGRPNVMDMVKNGEIQMIINTPSGMMPRKDENAMRAVAYAANICIMTTITGAFAAVAGIKALRQKSYEVRSIQSYLQQSVATV